MGYNKKNCVHMQVGESVHYMYNNDTIGHEIQEGVPTVNLVLALA